MSLFHLLIFTLLFPSLLASSCPHITQCDQPFPITFDLCLFPDESCTQHSTHQLGDRPVLFDREQLVKQVNNPPLSIQDKRQIIAAASRVLADVNCHRFLQLNFLKVDIVSDLNQFSQNLSPSQSNLQFHNSMFRIFQRINDFHTRYLPPPPLRTAVATVGFFLRSYFDSGNRSNPRFAVSEITSILNVSNPNFKQGVQVTTWDGLPVAQVIRRLGINSYASNPNAQFDRATDYITFRPLSILQIPTERFVELGFIDLAGKPGIIKLPWLFAELQDQNSIEAVARNRLYRFENYPILQNNHPFISLPSGLQSAFTSPSKRTSIQVAQFFRRFVSAEIIPTESGAIGRLVLPTFNRRASPELIGEISRVLRLLPSQGLIVDIRNNIGGLPDYAKAVTELFTDKQIEPRPVNIRNTPTNRQLFSPNGNLPEGTLRLFKTFRATLRTSGFTQEPFSSPAGDLFTLGLLTPFPRPKRVYFGPVITLVDGRTYSAGEIFASIQRDEETSLLIGTSGNTGGGGASTTSYSKFAALKPNLFKVLPGGVDFRTALIRHYRTGKRDGALIEWFGVKPRIRYFYTRRDAVESDADLWEYLGRKLRTMRINS